MKEDSVSKKEWEPKIIGFLCNWCSYTGADLAGTSRLQYPPNVRVIRVMCSSRVNPQLVLKAFQEGADGVLVSGCHPGDCHYIEGNYHARRKLTMLSDLIDYMGVGVCVCSVVMGGCHLGVVLLAVLKFFTIW